MIDVYAGPTNNAMRATIALAESGLPHRLHKLDLRKGEQHGAAFKKIHDSERVPVIVDSDGPGGKPITLSQSGAILIYVANKVGKFWPKTDAGKVSALEWVMHACTDAAPLSGVIFQSQHFAPVKTPENVAFFENRLVSVLAEADRRLATRRYLADELSVADFALFPVVKFWQELIEVRGLAHLTKWAADVGSRPGVAAGVAACSL